MNATEFTEATNIMVGSTVRAKEQGWLGRVVLLDDRGIAIWWDKSFPAGMAKTQEYQLQQAFEFLESYTPYDWKEIMRQNVE